MTRQRRTHLFFLALVPVLVFAAVRCADSTSPLTTARPSTVPPAGDPSARLVKLHAETDWIGEFHNDALRYVFTNLSRLPAKRRDKRTVCETARRAYAEFHQSRRGKPVPPSVDGQFESFCAAGSSDAGRSAVLGAPDVTVRRELSAEAQNLVDQVVPAIDASTSYPDLASRIASIEANAASSLSYDEASAVFTVGSIALNSATYWANNLTEWVPFTNTPDYAVLFAMRNFPQRNAVFTGFSNGIEPSSDFGAWADGVWNDAKKAAKRAAGADAKAGLKAIMGTALAELPVIYDLVIAAAAAGSIGAVLQF